MRAGTEFHRREFLLATAAAATLGFVGRARAAFPEKDIFFIVPYAPGGGFDTHVRAIAPALERMLPRMVNVVPLNVPGGAGSRAANQLARAKPDGTTIGVFNIPGMFDLQQEGKADYDLTRFTWIGSLGRDHYALAVGYDSPVKTVDDLRALSRTRPVKFTSTGPSSTAYAATLIAGEVLGIRTQLITGYKGSNDYVLGAVRGDGDAVITVLPTLRRMEEGKALRIIATFEAHGSLPGVPDAKVLAQPDLALIILERLVAGPPNMPNEIRDTLSSALIKAMADPAVVAWAKQADVELQPETAAQAAQILADQEKFFQKWKRYLTSG